MVKYKMTGLALMGTFALASPAMADNETTNLYVSACVPTIGCNSNTGSGGLAVQSYASASANGAGGGSVAARAGFSPNTTTLAGTYTSEATAIYTYTFRILGAANTLVPLHVHGYAYVSPIIAGTGDGGILTFAPDGTPSGTTGFAIKGGASLQVRGVAGYDFYGTPYYDYESISADNNIEFADIAGEGSLMDGTYKFMSNTDISVTLSAVAFLSHNPVGLNENVIGSIEAGADPTFTIDDPAFSAFSVVGVPDETPPSAVPEPASWAMMLGGFGLVGGAMRNRRTTTRREVLA